jgi:hypothetical protein
VAGHPRNFGARESNPFSLKLWITARTRSSDVNAIFRRRRDVNPLRRPQHDLRPPPAHHRPRPSSDDRQQPTALIVRQVTHLHPFNHAPSLRDDAHQMVDATPQTMPVTAPRQATFAVSCNGTSGLLAAMGTTRDMGHRTGASYRRIGAGFERLVTRRYVLRGRPRQVAELRSASWHQGAFSRRAGHGIIE